MRIENGLDNGMRLGFRADVAVVLAWQRRLGRRK